MPTSTIVFHFALAAYNKSTSLVKGPFFSFLFLRKLFKVIKLEVDHIPAIVKVVSFFGLQFVSSVAHDFVTWYSPSYVEPSLPAPAFVVF